MQTRCSIDREPLRAVDRGPHSSFQWLGRAVRALNVVRVAGRPSSGTTAQCANAFAGRFNLNLDDAGFLASSCPLTSIRSTWARSTRGLFSLGWPLIATPLAQRIS